MRQVAHSAEPSRLDLFEREDFNPKHDYLGIGKALDWCQERTVYWHGVLREYASRIGVTNRLPVLPKLKFAWTAPTNAATWNCANGGTIELHVPYALTAKEIAYDDTIAHEMCHHFQPHIYPVGSAMKCKLDAHGEMFYLLFHLGCKITWRPHTHDYNCKQAAKLAPLLAQHAKMLRIRQ